MRKYDAILAGSLCFIFLSAGRAEKIKLGDVSEKTDARAQKRTASPTQQTENTPEERKVIVDELAEESYAKGVTALRQGRLPEASSLFEKTLALSPNHARARQRLAAIRRRTEGQQPLQTKRKPAPVVEEKPKKSKPEPAPHAVEKPSPTAQQTKEQANTLYLQALTASQKGDTREAHRLCTAALKLDPENLQARRMCERLDIRFQRP